jgi:hypothetical protein
MPKEFNPEKEDSRLDNTNDPLLFVSHILYKNAQIPQERQLAEVTIQRLRHFKQGWVHFFQEKAPLVSTAMRRPVTIYDVVDYVWCHPPNARQVSPLYERVDIPHLQTDEDNFGGPIYPNHYRYFPLVSLVDTRLCMEGADSAAMDIAHAYARRVMNQLGVLRTNQNIEDLRKLPIWTSTTPGAYYHPSEKFADRLPTVLKNVYARVWFKHKPHLHIEGVMPLTLLERVIRPELSDLSAFQRSST